jgi:flagellin-specific chaperone FliS
MKAASLYMNSQTLTLDGERAFAELYGRLARWTGEIVALQRAGDSAAADDLIERAMTLLTHMDGQIDVSQNYELATRILCLHRFAVRTLVEAKLKPQANEVEGLAPVFVILAETFAAMKSPKSSVPGSAR